MKSKDAYFEEIASFKLLAKKDVGQNFLIDSSAASRIVDALELKADDKTLEIGCGAGSLTYFLEESQAVGEAIDIDDGLLSKLQNDFQNPSLVPTHGNAMKWDYSSYTKIVGNLPYYITSGILEKVLLGAEKAEKLVIMVQKEAADRLLGGVGSKEYGPLNVLIALSGSLKREFKVARSSFCPAPHVDSTVLSLAFDPNRNMEENRKTYSLCNELFLQRRKTISNNLKTIVKDAGKVAKILSVCGIDSAKRPEQVTPEQYLSLMKASL